MTAMLTGHHRLFLNTVLLGGTAEAKLAAARAAGFEQVELWRQDVVRPTAIRKPLSRR